MGNWIHYYDNGFVAKEMNYNMDSDDECSDGLPGANLKKNMFATCWRTGFPHINKKHSKWGRDGSPRAHTSSARSHGLYGAFGTQFSLISVYFRSICDDNQ